MQYRRALRRSLAGAAAINDAPASVVPPGGFARPFSLEGAAEPAGMARPATDVIRLIAASGTCGPGLGVAAAVSCGVGGMS